MEDIIIIGGGPIGLYAASLASLHGLKGIIIEGLNSLGGQLTSLYPEKEIIDLPGFNKIMAKDFINKLEKQRKSLPSSLSLHLNETVHSFIKQNDSFLLETSKGTYRTKTLLFATGMGVFSPRKIGLENEENFQNIIYSLTDINSLKDQDVTILGGGDSAVDWANTLAKIAKKVHIVHRRDDFRAQAHSVDEMIKNGVDILKPYNVVKLNGINNILTSLTLSSSNQTIELKTDCVFVNYGVITKPTSFPLETKLNAYVVQSDMQTNIEGIFAIGNACIYQGKVKNITSGLGEAVTAITKIDQLINPNKNIPIHF